jgi:exosortase/archaeosortase family protein
LILRLMNYLNSKAMLKSKAVKFSVTFVVLFLVFYYFNIGFFSITSPQSIHYNSFIADNFNYIRALRHLLLLSTAFVLRCAGFESVTNEFELLTAGRGGIRLVYSCLGLGLMSFFSAFVLAYPKPLKKKLLFLLSGLAVIQLLNVLRMTTVAIFGGSRAQHIIDHHIIFNGIIYIVIAIGLYFWVTAEERKNHAKN